LFIFAGVSDYLKAHEKYVNNHDAALGYLSNMILHKTLKGAGHLQMKSDL